jgi:hypothetical protein
MGFPIVIPWFSHGFYPLGKPIITPDSSELLPCREGAGAVLGAFFWAGSIGSYGGTPYHRWMVHFMVYFIYKWMRTGDSPISVETSICVMVKLAESGMS